MPRTNTPPASSPPSASVETANGPGNDLFVPLFLLLVWGQFFWALYPTWSHGQYYDYGWVIPPIAAWFFYRRWQVRERFSRPVSESKAHVSKTFLVILGIVSLFLLLTFLRILESFDTIWRLPLIFHAFAVFVYTHAAIWLNRGFRVSLTYLPLTLFALTASPWPAQIENLIIGELTDQLLAFSAPLSRFIGLDVVLSGSVLVSDGRVIEIDEGCSGIRSFQSLIMAGLFTGEFMMLRWGWRALLVILAMIFGFITNTIRASALCWVLIREGQLAFDSYHDLFGLLSFSLAAAMLLTAGSWMDHRVTAPKDPPPPQDK